MKIDLSKIDLEQFMVHEHIVAGETMWLVQPNHIGCKWTQNNKHFRSSLWDNDGNLVSAGFPKFTNWGENPENFPVPTSLKDTVVTEKIDGSLLIVSRWNNQLPAVCWFHYLNDQIILHRKYNHLRRIWLYCGRLTNLQGLVCLSCFYPLLSNGTYSAIPTPCLS